MSESGDPVGEVAARLRRGLGERYQIGERIGSGARSVVFSAHDRRHDRQVAIKCLTEGALRTDVARFLREVRTEARLSHPNIVSVLDSGEVEGLAYFVMPLADGESLRARLTREGELPLDDALGITRDIAAALQYAHDHHVFHRDVKPENILVTDKCVASLADFGLALSAAVPDDRLTHEGFAVGTARYMSPEQCSGDKIDGRSDQYSLACVLFEMLAGAPLYDGRNVQQILARHRFDPVPHIRDVRVNLPRGIDDALQRALAKLPADRFPSVLDFQRTLENAVTTESIARAHTNESPRVEPAPAQARRRARWRMFVGAVAVLSTATIVVRECGRAPSSTVLDANRMAIVPFDVVDLRDTLWKDGVVDLMSRAFDGLGPLRTVSATHVIRTFTGRSDEATASAFARRSNAGLVIYGQLVRNGADSARVVGTLWDVSRNRSIAEFDARDAYVRLPGVIDSLTVFLARELARTRAIAAVPRAPIPVASFPALRAWLQGEQAYRNNDYQSAAALYERAVGIDSSFALAYHGARNAFRALGSEVDAKSLWFALQGGRRNVGLPPRDSLLLLSDSLIATTPRSLAFFDNPAQARLRRRLSALELAAAAYPEDAEVWTELGELLDHFGYRLGRTPEQALVAFERAASADPAFAPAYYHLLELGLGLRHTDTVRAWVRRYVAHHPSDPRYITIDRLLSNPSGIERARATAQQLSPDSALDVAKMLGRWPEGASLAEAMFRELLRLGRSGRQVDTADVKNWFQSFLYRQGRLRDASDMLTSYNVGLLPLNALFAATYGALPGDSMSAMAARWIRSGDVRLTPLAAAWFAHRGRRADTSEVAWGWRLQPAMDPGRSMSSASRVAVEYSARSTRAYGVLLAGDSLRALDALSQLPDSLCPWTCWPQVEVTSRLLFAIRGPAASAAFLDGRPPPAGSSTLVEGLWYRERARAARAMGDSVRAKLLERRLSVVWRDADSILAGALRTFRPR